MEKEWFIDIDEKVEGPFSILELKRDSRLTFDTLVWKEGFAQWVPLRDVSELVHELFKEEETEKEEPPELEKSPPVIEEEIAVDFRKDLPPWLLWLIISVIILIFIYTYSNFNR